MVEINLPKLGSRWTDTHGNRYRVISTHEAEGHKWVYYMRENEINPEINREFSCYLESFLDRFWPLPE